MRDYNVIAGGRSVQDNLFVNVRTWSSINAEHLVMLRHAERLHTLAVPGFHAFDFQSGAIQNSKLILLCVLCKSFLFTLFALLVEISLRKTIYICIEI